MIYFNLFFEFFKIGLFSIGGGMATLPFLYNLSDKTGWFTTTQIADMLAVSESTPGPIGINMATYVGYIVGDLPGAVLASIGVILAGMMTVLLVTRILKKFRNNIYVDGAFYGLRPASVGLITAAGLMVAKITFLSIPEAFSIKSSAAISLFDILDYKTIVLAVILLILTRKINLTKELHPVIFIIISAVIGIIFSFSK